MRTPTVVVRRGLWTVVDQGFSSVSNLVLTIAVARTSDPTEFGVFSVAYLAFFLGLGLARALSHEPLLLAASAPPAEMPSETAPSRAGAVAGAGLVLGCIYAVGLASLGMAVGGRMGGPMVVFAACIPGLFLQDTWRYVLFSQGRSAAAAANDLLWCGLQLAAFAALEITGHGTVTTFVLAWGASAAVCAVAGAAQTRVLPRCRAGVDWVKAQRALGLPFAAEFVVYAGAGHVALLVIAAVSGLASVGAVRAALALFGPLQVLIVGLNVAALSEGSRLGDQARLRRVLVAFSVLCGCLGLAWGAALMALPEWVGTALLGPTWPLTRDLLVPTMIFVALWNATAAPATGLRVLRAAGRSLRTRAAACGLLVGLAFIGANIAGARGALAGFAVSQAIALVIWWKELRSAERRLAPGDVDGGESGAVDPPVRPEFSQ